MLLKMESAETKVLTEKSGLHQNYEHNTYISLVLTCKIVGNRNTYASAFLFTVYSKLETL